MGLGWWLGQAWGVAAGALLAAWLWMAWDMWRARKLLVWLRSTELQQAPAMSGLWGELPPACAAGCARVQQVQQGEQRLQDICGLAGQSQWRGAARCQGRIEWCNQMAASSSAWMRARRAAVHRQSGARSGFQCLFCAQDFAQPVLMQGRDSTAARPVRLSVQLYAYGDGRHLLLSRDITALEQAEAMRRDFVANVSHEIRTPLTVLAGFVETLQTLPLEEDERKRFWA
jgi:two-component system phosphate regulon sensor histidine kinase PhoR